MPIGGQTLYQKQKNQVILQKISLFDTRSDLRKSAASPFALHPLPYFMIVWPARL